MLLVRGFTAKSADDLISAALVLLDNAVGEYDATARLSQVECGPLPSRPERSPTRFPLAELPGYLDRL